MGRCKSFDSTADGYGRGEGFVAVVMQRNAGTPSAAIPVCGILLGSAVNQAGRSSGLTAPNGPSQSALIKTALRGACLGTASVRFVSVHGTGTALGDPIEIGALAQALPGGNTTGGSHAPLTLASNKSCYGHTEGAAGLTGLVLAASLVCQQATTAIMHLRSMNTYVEAALGDWGARGHKLIHLARQFATGAACVPQQTVAGTSSFGMSGVNAHMLVQTPTAADSTQVSAIVSVHAG